MGSAVIVLKTSTDKASLEDLVWQTSQLTTFCLQHKVEPIDCVVTFRGSDDILKQLKRVDRKKRFEYVIIYSPHQICKGRVEYNTFVSACREIYKAEVKYLRA